MPLPRILRFGASTGQTMPNNYHLLPHTAMNKTEYETFQSADVPENGLGTSSASSSGSAAASEGGWLTPEQMAQKLNVSRRCLGTWARDRIIPMIKIGRVCRFDLPQVMAALKHHEQGIAKR